MLFGFRGFPAGRCRPRFVTGIIDLQQIKTVWFWVGKKSQKSSKILASLGRKWIMESIESKRIAEKCKILSKRSILDNSGRSFENKLFNLFFSKSYFPTQKQQTMDKTAIPTCNLLFWSDFWKNKNIVKQGYRLEISQ